MAVTRERFEQGLTYDQYKAQMTRSRDKFEPRGLKSSLHVSKNVFTAKI